MSRKILGFLYFPTGLHPGLPPSLLRSLRRGTDKDVAPATKYLVVFIQHKDFCFLVAGLLLPTQTVTEPFFLIFFSTEKLR